MCPRVWPGVSNTSIAVRAKLERVAVADLHVDARDPRCIRARSDDPAAREPFQLEIPASVIGVVMRVQDMRKRPAALLERGDDRSRVGRVDRGRHVRSRGRARDSRSCPGGTGTDESRSGSCWLASDARASMVIVQCAGALRRRELEIRFLCRSSPCQTGPRGLSPITSTAARSRSRSARVSSATPSRSASTASSRDLARPIDRDARSRSSPARPGRRWSCCATTPRTCWPRRSRRLYPGTRSRSARPSRTASTTTSRATSRSRPRTSRRSRQPCTRSSTRDEPITREVWNRDEAVEFFREHGENYKAEIIDAFPTDEEITLYRQGDWIDLCRGPHVPSTGKLGKASSYEGRRRLLARRLATTPMLQRIYGTAWADDKELEAYCTASKRPRSATTASSAASWTSSISRKRRPAPCSGIRRAGRCSSTLDRLSCACGRSRPATTRSTRPSSSTRSLWEASGHWEKFGENMFTPTTADEQRVRDQADELPGPHPDLQARPA